VALASSRDDQGDGRSRPPPHRSWSRRPREERIGAIEAAARTVFGRRGYAEASIAEIAAEAGIAEGTIYKFFDSKRRLVTCVLERWYETMLAEFAGSLPGIQGARNKLRFIVWRHLTSLRDDLDIARLCLHEARNSRDYYQSEVYQLNRRYTHFLIEACREGIGSGEFRADTPVALVRDMIFGGIDHHSWAMLFGHGDIDPERSADLILSVVFAGIARPAIDGNSPDDSCVRIETVAARLEAIAARLEGKAG